MAQGEKKSCRARALHYDDNDHSQRELRDYEKTGGPGDYNDRSRYHGCMSLCV